MNKYSLSHLSDSVLLLELSALAARERTTVAELLAHIGEVEERRLYVPAGCPSMVDYCVRELHLSHDCAYKRINAARVARQFPAIFGALADGRLHLTTVVLLAPHLSVENAEVRLAAAASKTTFEIKQLLAAWSPRPDAPTLIQPIGPTLSGGFLDSNPIAAQLLNSSPNGPQILDSNPTSAGHLDSNPIADQGLLHVEAAPGPARVTPLSPQRFRFQVTIGQDMLETLRYAQSLLGHRVAAKNEVEVLGRALKFFVAHLEKCKFAATDRPRRSRRRSANKRHIPAEVRRAVWQRDGGQCTFVSSTGCRCASRHALEFDHVDPVARGGRATPDRMRLRCRAHNQFEAECAFGTQFMKEKREEAQRTAAARRAMEEARGATLRPTSRPTHQTDASRCVP